MTAVAPPPELADRPLSAAMREGSRREHADAEGSRFMAALLAGRVDEAGYVIYLRRLRCVYDALERIAAAHRAMPGFTELLDPALERLTAIDDDLAYWSGRCDVQPQASPSNATERYVERLEASARWPEGYLAHHYTRYLGDLSGGQAIGRILSREFGLSGGEGIHFYEFAGIAKPKPYKDAYRAHLDALALDVDERLAVVMEVKLAFRLNQALFEELDKVVDHHARVPMAERTD